MSFDPARITIRNMVDENGKPAGGIAKIDGRGYPSASITFQDGPLGRGDDRKEPNGAFVEDLIYICEKRLEFYERCGFGCEENDKALTHLTDARHALMRRTERREAEGVEGTHEGK